MRNLVALVVVVVIVGMLVWWKLQGRPTTTTTTTQTPTPVAVGSEVATAPTPTPTAQVRKLSHEDRKQLGAQIAASLQRVRAERAAAASQAAAGGTPPPSDDLVIPLEKVGKPLQDALNAAVPLLAKCYEAAGSATPKTAVAQMQMASDPDLGTVIDTAQMTDDTGKPLAKELDDCLRDTVENLALPPVGVPGKLMLQYSFKSD